MAEGPGPSGSRDRRETARIVVLVVAIAVLVALLIDNRHSVRIGYVVGDVEAPLLGVLALAAALGAVVGRHLEWRSDRARKRAR